MRKMTASMTSDTKSPRGSIADALMSGPLVGCWLIGQLGPKALPIRPQLGSCYLAKGRFFDLDAPLGRWQGATARPLMHGTLSDADLLRKLLLSCSLKVVFKFHAQILHRLLKTVNSRTI